MTEKDATQNTEYFQKVLAAVLTQSKEWISLNLAAFSERKWKESDSITPMVSVLAVFEVKFVVIWVFCP